jgi:hypothetical protein
MVGLIGFVVATAAVGLIAIQADRNAASESDALEIPIPEYVMSGADPNFGSECGENGTDVVTSGYGLNPDLSYHAENSIAVVEGVARIAGAARYQGIALDTAADKARQTESASDIVTPFTIDVLATHSGIDQPEWSVYQLGGLVDCVSNRIGSEWVTLFDGMEALLFINAQSEESHGDWVSMSIATDAPGWFYFSEKYFGAIANAIKIVKSTE